MIGSEMSDTPETLFAAGVELMVKHLRDVTIGWGCETVRFRSSGKWRIATAAAVRRLAADAWPSIDHWVRSYSDATLTAAILDRRR